ncbi:hypothetical protein [uncultured Thiodictyon sp.]|uniref:hypothetical protein n=1 Tax=uncultured Thiodictyon sp. TaxID=1846217 RepID=UPI0025FDF21D|nr:hypothetical protein [uncultured Thiodictyon sp.]
MSEITQRDAALVVLEQVMQVARQAAEEALKEDTPFAHGLKSAYYDVLAVALEQAALFELDPAAFGLGGYDPETLLVGHGRVAATA